jgi:hypothetical protein
MNAAEKDSTRWDFRVKGFDFEIGGNWIKASREQLLNVLKASTPAEERSRHNYNNVIVTSRNNEPYSQNAVWLSVVFSNDHDNYSSFFRKQELRFGIGYEILNSVWNHMKFDSIKMMEYPWVPGKSVVMQYAYQCQYALVGYQAASRPFLKYFAIFGGVEGRFGINTYKQIEMEDYYASLNGRKKENYSVGYFSTCACLGMKYNFSCDINFFAKFDAGINFYGNDIGGSARFAGLCLGMRYKIIDDQDRPKYELMKYW